MTDNEYNHHNDCNTWSPLVAIKPDLSESGNAILTDPRSGTRLRIDSGALTDVILKRFKGLLSPVDLQRTREIEYQLRRYALEAHHDESANIMNWIDRGWEDSLRYYLFSREIQYCDNADVSTGVRTSVLHQYLSTSSPPPRHIPAGDDQPLSTQFPKPIKLSVDKALTKRRTIRRFSNQQLDNTILSAILYYGFSAIRACRHKQSAESPLRLLLNSYGVAFDIYMTIYNIKGLEPGIYYYELSSHTVRRLSKDGVDFRNSATKLREQVNEILLHMGPPMTANWTLVLVADFEQYQWRYRHERALRNLYIEAGHIAQTLILLAMHYGVGSFPTPAGRDVDLVNLLSLDSEKQTPIYTLTMGHDPRFTDDPER